MRQSEFTENKRHTRYHLILWFSGENRDCERSSRHLFTFKLKLVVSPYTTFGIWSILRHTDKSFTFHI